MKCWYHNIIHGEKWLQSVSHINHYALSLNQNKDNLGAYQSHNSKWNSGRINLNWHRFYPNHNRRFWSFPSSTSFFTMIFLQLIWDMFLVVNFVSFDSCISFQVSEWLLYIYFLTMKISIEVLKVIDQFFRGFKTRIT